MPSSIGPSLGIPDPKFLFPTTGSEQTPPSDDKTFQNLVLRSLQEAGDMESNVHSMIAGGVEKQDLAMSESIIAMRKADLAMRLMLQVQRKLVDAWNELRNMQV